ncbi:MAG: tetratricopeptide repeat protein [bacterium]|nr:tetratricopeptide repeat protein [bacterium]
MINIDEKYYKKQEYIKVKKLFFDEKYEKYIEEAQKFLQKYPNSASVIFLMAKSYRKLNNFDGSIKILNNILKNNSNDKYALVELFYTYYYLREYSNCLELLPKLKKIECFEKTTFELIDLILSIKLNIIIDSKNKSDLLIKSQIINNDKSKTINRINKLVGDNTTDKSRARFNRNIRPGYLYDIILENLNPEFRANINDIFDIYYFNIPNIGYSDYEIYNRIKVVVAPETKNIISIFPVDNNVDEEYSIDLEIDYSKLYNSQKVKYKSQIDKFNKRYNR